jgi:hypothetical protein
MPAGRPSSFTQAKADEICRRIAAGESLRSVCRDPKMPTPETVRVWLQSRKEFLSQYAHAREEQADAIFEEMFEIADDGSNDWMERQKQDGSTEEVLNHEHVQRSKLRIDTRKWALARMAPRKYGDKLSLEHEGNVSFMVTTGVPERDRDGSEGN